MQFMIFYRQMRQVFWVTIGHRLYPLHQYFQSQASRNVFYSLQDKAPLKYI